MKSAARFALIVCTICSATLNAEPEPLDQLDMRGSEIFRALLHQQGLAPVDVKNPLAQRVDVLIVYGKEPQRKTQRAQLQSLARTLLNTGGAVLIATDQETELRNYFPQAIDGITIVGRSVQEMSPVECYRGIADLPVLRFGTLPYLDPDLALASNLTRVYTNQPSYFARGDEAYPLVDWAEYSPSARTESGGRPGPAVLVAPSGKMAAVVLADAGVLSNQMLAAGEPPADNLAFAMHLASYLAHGPNRSATRTHCLFWETDRFQTDFDAVKLSTPPLPEVRPSWSAIQRSLAQNAESKINELQQNDFPQRNLSRAIPFRQLMQSLCAIVAVAVLLGLFRRLFAARAERQNQTRSPLTRTPTTLADELRFADNFYPAVREQILWYFSKWGLGDSAKVQDVAMEGNWFYRRRMQNDLRTLNRIAFGTKPVRITKLRMQEIHLQIAEINDAWEKGTLQITEPKP